MSGVQGTDEHKESGAHSVALRREALKKEWSEEAKKANGFFASSGMGNRFKQLAKSLDLSLIHILQVHHNKKDR